MATVTSATTDRLKTSQKPFRFKGAWKQTCAHAGGALKYKTDIAKIWMQHEG